MALVSGYLQHDLLGRVHVTVRNNCLRLIARWKRDGLHVSAGPMYTPAMLREFLDTHADDILRIKPQPNLYTVPMRFEFPRFSVNIVRDLSLNPGHIRCRIAGHTPLEVDILVAGDVDPGESGAEQAIEKMLLRVVHSFGEIAVLAPAREIAEELGFKDFPLLLSRGGKRLGYCSNRRSIHLSSRLGFLPDELLRSVVCHEFAHVAHMDHSPEFHRLANHYMKGREKELDRKLKQFHWPVRL